MLKSIGLINLIESVFFFVLWRKQSESI